MIETLIELIIFKLPLIILGLIVISFCFSVLCILIGLAQALYRKFREWIGKPLPPKPIPRGSMSKGPHPTYPDCGYDSQASGKNYDGSDIE